MNRLVPLSLVLLCLGLGGCASWFGWIGGIGSAGGSITIRSDKTGAALSPNFVVAVYRSIDANTADVYLTDLPLARVMDPTDNLADATGNLVHVHLFVVPLAGATPLDRSACNATVRHAVVAGPARGLYSGAGYMTTETPGSNTYGATIREASMRLSGSTPDFADRLGPSVLSGSFTAALDEKTSLALADRLARLHASVVVKPMTP